MAPSRRPVPILTALLALGAAPGCEMPMVELECQHDEPLCQTLDVLADPRQPTTGLDVHGLYLYQGVENHLYWEGVDVTQDWPTIRNRDAQFRIFVTAHDDWNEREVTGRIYLYKGGDLYAAFQNDAHIAGTSNVDDIGSTINIRIPGVVFQDDVVFQIEVVELVEEMETFEAFAGVNVFPEDGFGLLTPTNVGEEVRVFLVPIEYNADSSGRLPDTSAGQLEIYEEAMWAFYPTPAVEIEVADEPLPTEVSVGALDTASWSNLLMQLAESREDYGADDDQYMYGVFEPRDTFDGFCGGGCIAGMSNLAAAGDPYSRSSIGLGYPGIGSAETMVHEVGHAHGRMHSPGCGADGVDPSYPVSTGLIDVVGYDLRDDSVKSPDAYYDFMSYCAPVWTSGYTFEALATRIAQVNGQAARGTPLTWATLWIHPDGNMAWGRDRTFVGQPSGEPVTVDLLLPDGRGFARADGFFSPLADVADAGVLSVRTGPWDTLRFDGRTSPARP